MQNKIYGNRTVLSDLVSIIFQKLAICKYVLLAVPELANIIGSVNIEELQAASDESLIKKSLQNCFTALMTSDPSFVTEQLKKLVSRLREAGNLLSHFKSYCIFFYENYKK